MEKSDILTKGDRFFATIKKGEYSKDLGGRERAGRVLGPFRALKESEVGVETDEHFFSHTSFLIKKAN